VFFQNKVKYNAYQRRHQITNGQIQDQKIGRGAHFPDVVNYVRDHAVPEGARRKDKKIKTDLCDLEACRFPLCFIWHYSWAASTSINCGCVYVHVGIIRRNHQRSDVE